MAQLPYARRLRDSLDGLRQADAAGLQAARDAVLDVVLEQAGGAGGPNINIRKALEVPVFTGDLQKDKITANEFLARADEAKDVGHLTDPDMLRYIKLRLQGKAWTWINNGTEAGAGWATDWPRFKVEFARRWADSATISEKVLLRKSLYQKTHENVQDFYDRVVHTENILQRDRTQAQRQAAGFRDMFNSNCLFNFLSGVKPEIHERVIAIGCDTLEAALENAIKAEKALFDTKKKKDGLVAALDQLQEAAKGQLNDQELEGFQQTMAALKLYENFGGRGRGRGRGRGSQRFQRGRGYNRGRGFGRGGYNNNYSFSGKCFHCDEFGHIERFCPKKGQQTAVVEDKRRNQPSYAVEQELNEVAPAWTTVTKQ